MWSKRKEQKKQQKLANYVNLLWYNCFIFLALLVYVCIFFHCRCDNCGYHCSCEINTYSCANNHSYNYCCACAKVKTTCERRDCGKSLRKT